MLLVHSCVLGKANRLRMTKQSVCRVMECIAAMMSMLEVIIASSATTAKDKTQKEGCDLIEAWIMRKEHHELEVETLEPKLEEKKTKL
jgi:hypothetical protein